MSQTVEAIYENGVLRPVEPLEGIGERARVNVTVEIRRDGQDAVVDGKPIWELAEELMQDVPEDVRARLPIDGAEQHDHYIYGTPKRR